MYQIFPFSFFSGESYEKPPNLSEFRMKMPFQNFLNPIFNNYFEYIQPFCGSKVAKILVRDWFVTVLGCVGMLFSTYELYQTVTLGPFLPNAFQRKPEPTQVLRPERERDIKLITGTLSFLHHFYLILGVFTTNPIFLLPWLFNESFVIVLDVIIFSIRLLSSGICLNRTTLLAFIISPMQWLTIVCYFKRLAMCKYGC